LDLTSEQKTKVEAILAAGRKQRAELQGRLNQDLKDLRASLRKDPPDEQAVLGQAEKIGALRTEQHKVALRTRLKVQAELTPQQREKLKQLRRVDREGSVKGKTGAAPPAGD
jgi:Spy/CpxP family protein refolding chaperone